MLRSDFPGAQDLPVRSYVLKEHPAHIFVPDFGGPLKQAIARLFEQAYCSRIVVGLEDSVAGKIDTKGLICTIQASAFQVAQNLFDIGMCLSELVLSERDPCQTSHRFHCGICLVKRAPDGQGIGIGTPGLVKMSQTSQGVTKTGQVYGLVIAVTDLAGYGERLPTQFLSALIIAKAVFQQAEVC